MKTAEILENLTTDSWAFEAWSEHPLEGDVYYTVKITCACQARGRFKGDGNTLDEALKKAYDKVVEKWGKEDLEKYKPKPLPIGSSFALFLADWNARRKK